MKTFQERMRYAINKLGGQNPAARALTIYLGRGATPVTQQSLGYLVKTPPGKKPATGSKLTPAIATLAGLRAEWLSDGKGPREAGAGVSRESARPAPELWPEIGDVHYSPQALEVARALDKLPQNMRDDFQKSIEVEALKYSSVKRDEKLGHLAAPNAPKKRVKG